MALRLGIALNQCLRLESVGLLHRLSHCHVHISHAKLRRSCRARVAIAMALQVPFSTTSTRPGDTSEQTSSCTLQPTAISARWPCEISGPRTALLGSKRWSSETGESSSIAPKASRATSRARRDCRQGANAVGSSSGRSGGGRSCHFVRSCRRSCRSGCHGWSPPCGGFSRFARCHAHLDSCGSCSCRSCRGCRSFSCRPRLPHEPYCHTKKEANSLRQTPTEPSGEAGMA